MTHVPCRRGNRLGGNRVRIDYKLGKKKEGPKTGRTGKYPFGRTNVLGEEVRQQLFQNGKFELDDIPNNFVVNAVVTVDKSIP